MENLKSMTRKILKLKVLLLIFLILLGISLVWLYFKPLPEKRGVDYSKLLYEREFVGVGPNTETGIWPFAPKAIHLLSLDIDGILIADGFVEARLDNNTIEQIKDKIKETQILDKKCTFGSIIDAQLLITIQLDGKKAKFDGFGSCREEEEEIYAIFSNMIKRYQ